jgi:hypothetical protein
MDKQARTPSNVLEPGPELDAAVAHAVMRWRSLGAHLWQDAEGTVYYTGHDPTRVFVPHTVFRPSSDIGQAIGVEAQIARLGKRQAYLDALLHALRVEEHVINVAYATGYPAPEDAPVVRQALVHATPAQRCRAAVTVCSAGGAGDADHTAQ